METNYDIGIVGGGMVGSLAARLLSDHFKVLLLDPQQSPLPGVGEVVAHSAAGEGVPPPTLRVSALNTASCNLLETAGVLSKIAPDHLSEILAMKVFDGDESLAFHGSDIGQVRLGYMVENQVLNQAILNSLPEEAVRWHHSACNHVTRHPKGFILEADDGTTHLVKLLVVAQGAMSSLRQTLGIQLSMNDYNQNAWVAHVETEKSHSYTAYQRFLPTGTLAFLPLVNPHWSSIVWALPSSEALNPEEFASRLYMAFPDLGPLKVLTQLASFPLCAQNADTYSGAGFALIGDAAHTVHPLAGQGVNLGFEDVARLSTVLIDAQNKKEDWASPSVLSRYAKHAKRHDERWSFGFSLINRLYQEENPLFVAARRFGTRRFSKMDLVKRFLMKCGVGH